MNETIDQAMQDLLDSPTLQSLIASAQGISMDDTEVKTRMAEYLVAVCQLLDDKLIQFNSDVDKSELQELLTIALYSCFDGDIDSHVQEVIVQ
ncbi:MAG: hypothetical protein KZQ83_20585 [gamma proteobacterium symbiont of Taylorina sp.]|nr:hypothetical protein [gamma proteobacterium symbiont of Taylorina sp.]